MFSVKTCTPHILPTPPIILVNSTSTSNIENVEPIHNTKTKSSFGPILVTISLTKNCDMNYIKDLNKIAQLFTLEEDVRTYEEAMHSIDSKFWKEVFNDEK